MPVIKIGAISIAFEKINSLLLKSRKLFINKKEVMDFNGLPQTASITIEVVGDIAALSSDSGDVFITGTAGTVSSVSGDISAKDITCQTISGDVSTVSGDIKR